MPDPRFARIRSDPRFRKPKKQQNKLVVDPRFKAIFDDEDKPKRAAKIDKYGRRISSKNNKEDLHRFYRLENQDDTSKPGPDYARGEGLLESSSEDEDDDESDVDKVVYLGRDVSDPEEDAPLPEIDLDESAFAELDAQAAAFRDQDQRDEEESQANSKATRRIAVVNLDWEYVKAQHLYKIFSSVMSSKSSIVANKGRVLNVRVYPSQFGKERMEKEEKEGPPAEVFKKSKKEGDDLDESDILVLAQDDKDYDEDALRKYQLERLRYYYAVVTCDSPETASHIYHELEGTELERSANVFDLSYIPDDMTFDDEFRDEANEEMIAGTYAPVEFVTDALRHSKVKLTWDDDDPGRVKVTRRNLSRKEIDETDFKALIASSSSEAESSEDEAKESKRGKLRALLLGGGDENPDLPEGWGGSKLREGDMEITFTPGLSESKTVDEEQETTIQRYKRKQMEKKAKRKAERQQGSHDGPGENRKEGDDFFGDDSASDKEDRRAKTKGKGKARQKNPVEEVRASTAEELALVAASSKDSELEHFDLRAVIKSEKGVKHKRKGKKKQLGNEALDETQDKFQINVNDERFKALHEDHQFAIDPSNPQFTKTKSMSAVLSEGSRRRNNHQSPPSTEADLHSLVERVKRKAAQMDAPPKGKRQKI
ncbi:hypothetical protein SISNIDRAFT_451626 [Sistotremastrum niveocremeum HHB9708]|uniref:Uncharacterized protein n=1 Tax=Sistotremastrum niveocremeum HHB9708 TaxID=1314777 RepID=A0A164XGV6_9AGAM|nr:hypothetical protein SISNIDRAFT_451626 [Sistotremastrum niveocremeum HHB9708]